jgi:pimeloyl-ACP methyl ester carboxylesterase
MRTKTITCCAAALLLLCMLFLYGCATPIGVNAVSPRDSYNDAYANPLNADVLSDQAKFVLNRHFLLDTYADDPVAAIAALHDKALHDDRRDILYALAEASYLYGSKLAKSSILPITTQVELQKEWPYSSRLAEEQKKLSKDYFLMAAVYAYNFCLEERDGQSLSQFDSRIRNAVDMYNYGLWQGFETGENEQLVLKGGERKLPFGTLTITVDESHSPWKLEDFDRFEPADKYKVRGVSVRNRNPGVGLPLIGIKKQSGQSLPLTAFLRLQIGLAAMNSGANSASLEFYSALDSSTIALNNRSVPLGTDITTPLAYRMEGSNFFDLSLGAFFGREPNKIPDGLYLKEPYRSGKIPVVLVHGTASSPVWWVELLNTLTADPLIREKYQFWYFVYTSNKVVAASAAELRDALSERVAVLDPLGKDPALQQMVVVGHSQGGLLTKFTAVDTGDRLVQVLTGKDLAGLDMPEKKKAQIGKLLVVKPLPFVKTVIFFSTPHRGSFQSKEWNRNLVRWLITLPANLVETTMETFDYLTDDVKKMMGGKKTIFTSADAMSPDNPVLKVLAEIPLAPGVKGHSIIAVKSDGDPKLGDDGVVKYSSAHLDGMESELIVKGGHSSQLNPLAIDEMRRILVENLAKSSGATPGK